MKQFFAGLGKLFFVLIQLFILATVVAVSLSFYTHLM